MVHDSDMWPPKWQSRSSVSVIDQSILELNMAMHWADLVENALLYSSSPIALVEVSDNGEVSI